MSDSKTIEISGYTYETNVIDLTDEEFESLVNAIEEGDVWSGNEELEERLRDDSIINGYKIKEGSPHFEINVDGEKVDLNDLGVDFSDVDEPTPALKSHQLVFEKWCKKSTDTFDLSEEFDLSKLELYTDNYTLPTGAKRLVATPYYDGDSFEFQGSWTEAEEIYIVKKNGEVIQVE